jgi:Domain of unknown function (DUF4169)
MAEVVNLRTVRKQRARAEGRRRGDAAAAKTGPVAAEAERVRAEAARERAEHDGHRLEPPED